jgi:hypothetical protein
MERETILGTYRFETLEELQQAVSDLLIDTAEHRPETVYVTGPRTGPTKLQLVERTLGDGSTVVDIIIPQ